MVRRPVQRVKNKLVVQFFLVEVMKAFDVDDEYLGNEFKVALGGAADAVDV